MYMKKIISIALIMTLLSLIVEAGNIIIENKESVKLRHGFKYTFFNSINAGNQYMWINGIKGKFIETGGYDYNGGRVPKFEVPKVLKDLGKKNSYHIAPHKEAVVFKSIENYRIHFHPKVRKADNLVIEYNTYYQTWDLKTKKWSEKKQLNTVQPYEITWCGDGIIDNYTDKYANVEIKEICDPGDKSKGAKLV